MSHFLIFLSLTLLPPPLSPNSSVLPNRDFLQVLDLLDRLSIEGEEKKGEEEKREEKKKEQEKEKEKEDEEKKEGHRLCYDEEWLAILRATSSLETFSEVSTPSIHPDIVQLTPLLLITEKSSDSTSAPSARAEKRPPEP